MMSVWEKRKARESEIETLRVQIKQSSAELKRFARPPMTREQARSATTRQISDAWKLSGTKEKLNLIVLDTDERGRVFRSDMLKLFPKGLAHLPDLLQPREIYPITPNGKKRIQYIGKSKREGFTFVIFRVLSS